MSCRKKASETCLPQAGRRRRYSDALVRRQVVSRARQALVPPEGRRRRTQDCKAVCPMVHGQALYRMVQGGATYRYGTWRRRRDSNPRSRRAGLRFSRPPPSTARPLLRATGRMSHCSVRAAKRGNRQSAAGGPQCSGHLPRLLRRVMCAPTSVSGPDPLLPGRWAQHKSASCRMSLEAQPEERS
jgi:hypothetical protein